MTEELMVHFPAAVRAAQQLLGCPFDAEDCAAKALLQLLDRADPLEADSLEAVLVAIAKRRAIDLIRSRERERRLVGRLAPLQHDEDVAERVTARAEATWAATAARQLLPETGLRALRLLGEGVPMRVVALELDMSKRAAEGHVYRARKTMQSALSRALAAFALIGTAVRRLGPGPAPTVTAAMASLLLVLGPALSHPGFGVPGPAPQVAPASAHPGQFTAVLEDDRLATFRAAASRRTPAGRPKTSATVAELRAPARTQATVSKKDRGGDEGDAVEVLTSCLDNLDITLHHIGC